MAGVFTQKDQHLLILALQIAEIILLKFSDHFLNLFIKEGVFFAVDALLASGSSSELTYPVFAGIQMAFDSSQTSSSGDFKCPCYAFSTNQSCTTVSDPGTCKLEKDTIINLAKHIKSKFMTPELYDSEKGLTEILQNLRSLSMALNDSLSTPRDGSRALSEEKVDDILYQIMEKLTCKEQVSTFEFIESGIVKSLTNYLSNGHLMRKSGGRQGDYDVVIEKRFEVLARVCLSYPQLLSVDTPISSLIRNLHSALISLETFPVILSNGVKLRSSFATVPNRRQIPHPCLKVRFVKGEGETLLNSCTEDFLPADPFSSLHDIEGYLWQKVSLKSTSHVELSSNQVAFPAENQSIQASSSSQVNIGPDF